MPLVRNVIPAFARARPASPARKGSATIPPSMPALSVPALSVVLPVYNGKRYVRAAIESVLNQTFTDFELIAVDDGSSDSSLQILQQFGQARRAGAGRQPCPTLAMAGAMK